MKNNFFNLLIGLVLVVVFTGLLLSGIGSFANTYEKDTSTVLDGALTSSTFSRAYENLTDSAENQRQRFSDATGEEEGGNQEETGWWLFGILSDLQSLIIAPFSVLSQVLVNVLKLPSSFISIVLGILSIVIIATLWKLWRQGE